MRPIKIRVISNIRSCRDTTVGNIYEAVYLEANEVQPTTGIECDRPMIYFIDDTGDEVYTYVDSYLVDMGDKEWA